MEPKDPLIKTVNISKSEKEKARLRVLGVGDGCVGEYINYRIQSRNKILYIQTHEERRVIDFFQDLSIRRGSEILQWDCDRGLLSSETRERIVVDDSEVHESPLAVLSHIVDRASNQAKKISYNQKSSEVIYLLLDFHVFLDNGLPQIDRKLKEFCDTVSTCTIVIVSPVFVCPVSLEKEITLVDFPYPSYKEVKDTLLRIAEEIALKLPKAAQQARDNEEELIKATSGLTLNESENAYAMTIAKDKEFNMKTLLNEKKQVIRKSGILEYLDPRFTLDQIGGLDTLKDWLLLRHVAFKDDARDFGLPVPKGVLLLGIPGCVLGDTKIKIKKVSDKGKHRITIK